MTITARKFVTLSITFTLTLTLSSSVTLVTQDMFSYGPTFFSFNPTVQDKATVLTLETAWVKVPVHGSDPGSLGLAPLGHNGLGAHTA